MEDTTIVFVFLHTVKFKFSDVNLLLAFFSPQVGKGIKKKNCHEVD